MQYRLWHGHRDLLAFAGLLTTNERGQDADQKMHAGVAVAERRSADRRRTIPKPGRRGAAARALRHVVINTDILIRGAFAEALDRPENNPRVELLNMLPAQPHPVHRAWPEVLDQHIGLADKLLHDRLPSRPPCLHLHPPLLSVDLL